MVGRLTPSSRATSAIRTLTPLRSMHRRAASRIRCVASASSAGGRPAQLGAIFVALWPDTRVDLTLCLPCKVLLFSTGHSPARDEGHVSNHSRLLLEQFHRAAGGGEGARPLDRSHWSLCRCTLGRPGGRGRQGGATGDR